jgi:hypothetical protein
MPNKYFLIQNISKLSTFITISVLLLNTPIFINSASASQDLDPRKEGGGAVDKPELSPVPTPVPAPAKTRVRNTIFRAPAKIVLAGKITSADGNAAETPCSSISVTLNELIPGKTISDFGSGLNSNKVAQGKATGSTLNNGCTYSLDHDVNPIGKRDDRARFELSATAPIKNPTCSFSETKQFKEVPSTLDLSMVQSCLR